MSRVELIFLSLPKHIPVYDWDYQDYVHTVKISLLTVSALHGLSGHLTRNVIIVHEISS